MTINDQGARGRGPGAKGVVDAYRHPTPDTRRLPKRRASRGFSLIEMMVSMVIGLFILAGVVYVMANSRKNYETTDYTARLQENARFALHYLGYDLRNAGFWGCSDTVTWSSSAILGESLGSSYTPYGDSIRIEYADPNTAFLVASGASSGSNTITLTSSPSSSQIDEDDWIIVSDCSGADDAVVSSRSGATLTLSGPLERNFSGIIEVRKLISHRYYVAPLSGSGNLGVLCQENQKGTPNTSDFPGTCSAPDDPDTLDRTDLVQGVDYMRVLYGMDTNADGVPDSYLDYAGVVSAGGNWNQVVAVQLGLLVRSVSNYRPDINPNREFGSAEAGDVDTKTYSILDKTGGTAVNPADLRVARRVITETIQIRNATMSSPST